MKLPDPDEIIPAASDAIPVPAVKGMGVYAWYVLAVMVIVLTLSLVDRQILSILAEDVKRDLDLTDAQLGFLYGTAFAIFYTLFGIPLGRLADGWWRTRLMALGLILWSAMTVMTGMASSLTMLAVARIGVGFGEACASPAAYSILADTFPKHRRALAVSIYSIGGYLGIGLSLPIGGWLSDSWNSAYSVGQAPLGLAGWQAAFIGVGAPGLLVAAWVLSLREPPRRGVDGAPLPPVRKGVWRIFLVDTLSILPPFSIFALARFKGGLMRNLRTGLLIAAAMTLLILWTGDYGQWLAFGAGVYAFMSWGQSLRHTDPPAYELIWKRPAVPLCMLAIGGVSVTLNSFSLWAAPYAIRTYGITASEVGPLIGVPGAIVSAIGSVLGGLLADWWKQRDPRGRIFTCMIAAGIPIPLIFWMFTRTDVDTYLLISPLVYLATSFLSGAAVTMLQDFVLPRMYGTVGALFVFSANILGLAIGPYAAGKIATVTGSLQLGVFCIMIAPAAAFVVLWILGRIAAKSENGKLAWAIEAGEPLGDHR